MRGAEGAGEAGLRGKTGGKRHFGQAEPGFGDQTACFGQAQVQVMGLWRGAQGGLEMGLQIARADADLPR